MFKRWIVLLTAILVLEAVTIAYLSNRISNTFDDGCMEYLDSIENLDDWVSKNDNYFFITCDLDNPVSNARINILVREGLDNLHDRLVAVFIATLGMLLISLVARWVYKGLLR